MKTPRLFGIIKTRLRYIKVRYLYLTAITGVMIYALYSSLSGYLDLPIVGVNQAGECAYIETSGVRDYTCGTMPTKYIMERVQ